MPTLTTNPQGEFIATGITAIDKPIVPVPVGSCVACGLATLLRIGASCTVASAVLSVNLYLFTSSGAVVAVIPIQFIASMTVDVGLMYSGTSTSDNWFPLAGAKSLAVLVTGVSAGAWTLAGVMQ